MVAKVKADSGKSGSKRKRADGVMIKVRISREAFRMLDFVASEYAATKVDALTEMIVMHYIHVRYPELNVGFTREETG